MDEKEEQKKEEQKATEEAKTVDTEKDSATGVQPQTDGLIEQSNKAAERNEKVLKDLKKENDRTEKLIVERQLAGRGASIPAPIQEDPEKIASDKRINDVGKATGAKWAEPKAEDPTTTTQ